MQTSAKFHGTVHLGTILRHGFGHPTAWAKMNYDIMAKPCAVHFVSIC